jgi:nitrogen fixation/metabolism regulation signal transduction histidine kinase
MPPIPKTKSIKLRKLLNEFGSVFSINTDQITKTETLFCNSCEVKVNCDQRSDSTQIQLFIKNLLRNSKQNN